MDNALRTGTALAVTVAVGYAVCAVVFWLWPQLALQFMNGLFHGLDFGALQRGPTLFDFRGFLGVLFVMAIWAFAVGALFGWVFSKLEKTA